MRPSWAKIIVALVALWAVVYGGISWLQSRRPTAEKVSAFVEANSLDGKSEKERLAIIEQVAEQVNKLSEEERHKARPSRSLEKFWKSLTAAERGHYFDLVVPRGLQVAIERFNNLPPDRQKREIERAVRDMRANADEEMPEDFDPQLAKKFVDEGLKTFYRDATIEAKMNALPLLEELEKNFKWRR